MLSRQENRLNRIIKILQLSNPTTVNKLASVLDVSHMTIRRDLGLLQEKGTVDIFHGGVVLKDVTKRKQNPYSLSHANKQMNEEKKQIAAKAVSYLEQGNTVILDTGSTVEFLARHFPEDLPAKVICFTINSLLHLTKLKTVDIIFPGGYFHDNTMMFESREGIKLISNNPADTAFVSASGISIEMGVCCSNEYERKTKYALMKSAKTKILMADSSKFDKVKSVHFAELTDFDVIITDKNVPEKYSDFCKANKISLITV